MSGNDLSQYSMADLFRIEAESQTQALTAGLLALERDPGSAEQLGVCMRAAHSLKGAARIVGISAGVTVAHAMEDCFVAAQRREIALDRSRIDVLLRGVDLLTAIASTPEAQAGRWLTEAQMEVSDFLSSLARTQPSEAAQDAAPDILSPAADTAASRAPSAINDAEDNGVQADRMLRVTADDLNDLLGLADASQMAFRRLRPFIALLSDLKQLQHRSGRAIEALSELSPGEETGGPLNAAITEAQSGLLECQRFLGKRLAELDALDRQFTVLAHRLYDQALECRMRPFGDGAKAFPRMIRDLSQQLGKEARLEFSGLATRVDREMLQLLDAPIGHLLRNAIDHGIEQPHQRKTGGKSEEGIIRLEARHVAGSLQIIVADDGAGIDLNELRDAVVRRKLTATNRVTDLTDAELLEFLFLPGFTMKTSVTDISGRGFGLNVVREMIQKVRGTVQILTQRGIGTSFVMRLPLSLSVIRALLVEIGDEAYGLPLASLQCALRLPKERIESLEGRQHFEFQGQQVGLISGRQILDYNTPDESGGDLCVVLLSSHQGIYGIVVDRFLGEHELVVQTLDPRLGNIKDVSVGALMEDGSPVLILDIDDLIRSAEKLAVAGGLTRIGASAAKQMEIRRKRVLVVDDSFTVREVERKLLSQCGYEIEIAVDGMDGWNAVRAGHFDLVVTDIDMPRMDGIELVTLIKGDHALKATPVLIVSYKDRDEDRRRGLSAGADYYLSKGSFHDEALIRAVTDLIGGPES